jgi:SAM-dependent methyltransferase
MFKDETSRLIALLDAADRLPGASEMRLRSYELLGAALGRSVVDVGCGAGRAVAEMAGRGARAVGVDIQDKMIAAARERWPQAEFEVAGAYELPFADGTLDGYRADKVFHELDDPARALAEAQRVLTPGGRIVLTVQDWDAFVIDADDAGLTRTIVHARADLLPSPRAARHCRNLLLDGGFDDVGAEAAMAVLTDPAVLPMLVGLAEGARSAGAVSGPHAEAWVAEQRERARAGRLFLAIPLFIASATKP